MTPCAHEFDVLRQCTKCGLGSVRPVCDICGTRETRRNVRWRHVDDGCSGVHDYYACDRCELADQMKRGKVLWAEGPLWRPKEPVRVDEEARDPAYYAAIRLLLNTGTGQVSLFDVSGDTEHYWYAEPPLDDPVTT